MNCNNTHHETIFAKLEVSNDTFSENDTMC